MRIGIKIDIGFAESDVYRQLYGEREILPYLRGLGVEAVETPVGLDTDGQALENHIRTCVAAGMLVSLHPYTELTPSNPAHFSASEDNPCLQLHRHFLEIAAETAALQQAPTVVNIHSAAAPLDIPRQDLVEQSIRFFSWAREWCEANAPEVQPVAELQIRPNPDEPIQRIGDFYAELYEVVQRSRVGACWDLGHAVMNTDRFGVPLYPPIDWLPWVTHIHCHDVGPEDHQPLIFGNVPWERFLRSLLPYGFDGTVILELTPDRFLPYEGLVDLERSVGALVKFAEKHQSKA